MRIHAQVHAAAMAASVLVLFPGGAHAATISSLGTSSLPGASTGSIGPVGATPAANNDNATTASPNVIPYSVFFNKQGPVAVEFLTAASGGATEYRFTQTFVNNTGQAWTGFTFELGYGVGDAFVASGADDGLDFDTPGADPAPTASLFTTLVHRDDRMEWSGGSVPSIGSLSLTFAIDVPDEVSRFTLRQTPITAAIPEPSSLGLAGAGALMLAAWRRCGRSAY